MGYVEFIGFVAIFRLRIFSSYLTQLKPATELNDHKMIEVRYV